jgi:hypothetical protein
VIKIELEAEIYTAGELLEYCFADFLGNALVIPTSRTAEIPLRMIADELIPFQTVPPTFNKVSNIFVSVWICGFLKIFGVLEYWSNWKNIQYSSTPNLHYSCFLWNKTYFSVDC